MSFCTYYTETRQVPVDGLSLNGTANGTMAATMKTINYTYQFCSPPVGPLDELRMLFSKMEALKVAFQISVDFWLSFFVSLIGIVNNIIVLAVFTKQGFKDSVTISMTAIAIWDLAKCLAAALQRLSGPIRLIDVAAGVSWENIGELVFKYFIFFSCYVSSVLAAFVSLERCLCVSMPFKVKRIFTPKVVGITCLAISVVVFGSYAVVWSIYEIRWTFYLLDGASYSYDYSGVVDVIEYTINPDADNYQGILDYYNNSIIGWPLLSFLVISVCTVITIIQLRRSSKFRSRGLDGTSGNGEERLSKRDRQITKMLLVIMAIYIVNLLPRIGFFIGQRLVKWLEGFVDDYITSALRFLPFYAMSDVISYFITFIDLLNATVNLYVFLKMSTSFRTTFFSMFPRCRAVKTTGHPTGGSSAHASATRPQIQ